jgi:hypothetical protein
MSTDPIGPAVPPAADDPAGTQDALAILIHDEQCTRPRPCGYGLPRHGHDAYYHERAEAVYSKLAPEIGAANVLLATRVILDELM